MAAENDEEKKVENKLKKWMPLAVDYGNYDPLMVGSIDGTDLRPHDRAIIRACNTEYRPNRQVQGDPHKTIFVAHLSMSTTEDQVYEHFIKYGKIKSYRLVRDIVTGQSKGYAFIEYKHTSDADRAYDRAHHSTINDKEIIVDMEMERVLPGWKPRRFGGGFGGKKESGQLRFGGRERPFKRPIVLGGRHHHHYRDRRDSTDEHWKRRTSFEKHSNY